MKLLHQVPGGLGLSRTPHGVRGLKSDHIAANMEALNVAPHTGCVD